MPNMCAIYPRPSSFHPKRAFHTAVLRTHSISFKMNLKQVYLSEWTWRRHRRLAECSLWSLLLSERLWAWCSAAEIRLDCGSTHKHMLSVPLGSAHVNKGLQERRHTEDLGKVRFHYVLGITVLKMFHLVCLNLSMRLPICWPRHS